MSRTHSIHSALSALDDAPVWLDSGDRTIGEEFALLSSGRWLDHVPFSRPRPQPGPRAAGLERHSPLPRAPRRSAGDEHGVDVDASGEGSVDEPRMYQLVRQDGGAADRTFEVTFTKPGVRACVVTFR
jgi:hypothetical protein